MALSVYDVSRIVSLTINEARPIAQIARLLQLDYKQLYDYLKTKKAAQLFGFQKIDGLIWVRPGPKGLNLTKGTQISNSPTIDQENAYYRPFGKCGIERIKAIKLSLNTIDIRRIKDPCMDQYYDYLDRCENAELVFVPNPEKNLFGPLMTMPYRTRFNDEGRKVEALKRYESIWDKCSSQYKNAVFLTLTTDPKMQTNLWDANKKISKNFNRFMSFLTRRLGYRPKYLNVYEFQGNGRLHLHIMFFGIKYLISGDEMRKLWIKYGQGEIFKFISIKNNNGSWEWVKQKPSDAGNKSPIDYLKKYLKKALYDEGALYQYWIYNTRFFTYSRDLAPLIGYYISKQLYIFVGAFYDGIPSWVERTKLNKGTAGPARVHDPPPPKSEDIRNLRKIAGTSW
jgi:hypothetical protein